METAFGREFSRVRIHRGPETGAVTHGLDALAFTHRNHVYFGPGMYDVASASGRHLLAHELAHVAQQGYATPRPPGRPTKAVHASPPSIQRTATWNVTKPNEVNNLAERFINNEGAGETIVILNSTRLAMSNTVLDDAAKTIRAPNLKVTAPPKGDVTVRVASAPTNTAGYDQRVLTTGPWTVVTTQANIGSILGLPACTGKGNTTFRAIGKPDDKTVHDLNIGHEGEHVKTQKKAFEDWVGKWDKNLTDAAKVKTPFTAATEAEATAQLYAAMNGTPDEIARQFIQTVNDEGLAFHSTPRGDNVHFSNQNSSADCSTSWAEARNPYTP
jgi:hypothetical protein